MLSLALSNMCTLLFFAEEESRKVRQMVEEQKQNMNLSAVRLCFQAYLPDDTGSFTKALPPCLSNAVFDSSEINYIKFHHFVIKRLSVGASVKHRI